MKNSNIFKIISATLILLIGMLVASSCTMEGDGIFEQVVSQGASSSYRIKQYLGNMAEDTTDVYYFIEENGLYRNGSNVYPGNFSTGYMKGADIYLYDNKTAHIVTFNTSSKTTSSDFGTRTFNKITDYGYAIETEKAENGKVSAVAIWDLDTKSVIPNFTSDTLSKFSSCMSSEDSIIVEIYDKEGYIAGNSYYLYDRASGSFGKVNNLSGMVIGAFQKVNNDIYYVVFTRNDSKMYSVAYKIASSGTDFNAKAVRNLNYLLRDSSQSASFYDEAIGKGSVVIRSASKYEVLSKASTDTPSYSEKDSGYAAGIYANDMELMNIRRKTGTSDDTFVFAFYKYGLFLVTPSTNAIPVQIKW